MKLLHESIHWHGIGSTNLLIKQDFPAYMAHNKKKDDKEITHCAGSNYLLFGVTKTPSEGLRTKLSVSVRSVYECKPFSSPEDVGSMFLRKIVT